MGKHSSQKESGDELLSNINVIPLVDISLVLLIIFMVTASYIMISSFEVNLPKASHGKTGQQGNTVTINVSREGLIYLESKAVSRDELRTQMKMESTANPNLAVVLAVDKNTNFKNVVDVLDLLYELNINKLSIAALNE